MHFPDWLEDYQALPFPVLKADVWRYLVIYREGGVYTDVDTYCRVPIHEWLASAPTTTWTGVSKVQLLLGYEIPDPHPTLCQWTFAAAPRHPLMAMVLTQLRRNLRQFVVTGCKVRTMKDVLDITGPHLFGRIMARELHAPIKPPHELTPVKGAYPKYGAVVLPEYMLGFPCNNGTPPYTICVQHTYHGKTAGGWWGDIHWWYRSAHNPTVIVLFMVVLLVVVVSSLLAVRAAHGKEKR